MSTPVDTNGQELISQNDRGQIKSTTLGFIKTAEEQRLGVGGLVLFGGGGVSEGGRDEPAAPGRSTASVCQAWTLESKEQEEPTFPLI